MTTVKSLFIHPVKGLTPQAENQVSLRVGHGIPGDRAYALMYESPVCNPPLVPWMKKQNFAMQCDWPGLAALNCQYNADTGVLTVKRKGVELLVAETHSSTSRDCIGAFFTGYLAAIYPSQAAKHPERARLRLVGSYTHTTRYPDRELGHLSLISQATLDAVSAAAGKPIDARRFRPNIVVEGIEAWSELGWVGQYMQIGTAQVKITALINRCLNIDVNPTTGERDVSLLALLQNHFALKQAGVLAEVIVSGTVAVGDELTIKSLSLA